MKERFKPTKQALLTPRFCSKCGRFMDREFLEHRRNTAIERQKESRWKNKETTKQCQSQPQ